MRTHASDGVPKCQKLQSTVDQAAGTCCGARVSQGFSTSRVMEGGRYHLLVVLFFVSVASAGGCRTHNEARGLGEQLEPGSVSSAGEPAQSSQPENSASSSVHAEEPDSLVDESDFVLLVPGSQRAREISSTVAHPILLVEPRVKFPMVVERMGSNGPEYRQVENCLEFLGIYCHQDRSWSLKGTYDWSEERRSLMPMRSSSTDPVYTRYRDAMSCLLSVSAFDWPDHASEMDVPFALGSLGDLLDSICVLESGPERFLNFSMWVYLHTNEASTCSDVPVVPHGNDNRWIPLSALDECDGQDPPEEHQCRVVPAERQVILSDRGLRWTLLGATILSDAGNDGSAVVWLVEAPNRDVHRRMWRMEALVQYLYSTSQDRYGRGFVDGGEFVGLEMIDGPGLSTVGSTEAPVFAMNGLLCSQYAEQRDP